MSTQTTRRVLALLVGGFLLQIGLQNGCAQYTGYAVAGAVDWCAIVNCGSGTFFSFCSPVRMFVDCPVTTTAP